MQITGIAKSVQTKVNKTVMISAAAALIASGFFVPKAFGAGGEDPCADGIPDAGIHLTPGTKGVGSLDVNLDGSWSWACATPIVSYSWDFGDGSTASGISVNHQYSVGTFTPSLTITDEAGLTNTRSYYTPITVKADNQAPVLSDTSTEVAYNSSIDINLSGSDPDGDDLSRGYYLPGDSSYGSWIWTNKGHVSRLSSAGTFRYYASSGQTGQDSFEVAVADGFGGVATTTVTVTILPPPNRAPVAYGRSITMQEDSSVNTDIVSGSFDPDGDSYTASMVSGPAHGTASLTPAGVLSYVPEANYSGSDNVTFQLTDSHGNVSNVATTNITVSPVNDRPVATGDSAAVDEDRSITVNVLANDNDIEDGQNLSIALMSNPSHGTVVKNTDNTFTYTPSANYFGADSFTYRVVDTQGATSSIVTVSLTVNSVNDNPTANFVYSLNSGGRVSFNASNSSDVDGSIVSYSWVFGDGSTGTGISPTHKYSDKNGNYQVTLTVTDNTGATATYTQTVSL